MAEALHNRVRELREARGWTQLDLAEQMGVSRKTVNTIENGIFVPSTIVSLKMARALKQPLETIFWLP
ncbi:helix-turn-helix transcriptional regulator [Sphingomonas japonica]|uniref:Transcriptional regulator n=1 Tax=Sphingomonas japonica TaxID=511662 RepID=A0ABX0U515_9SPHN|nr:helix-turn-helix transcriptional regulator [Sphingomonas japonica]NIJ23882.1 putative transcriptional regulator [Sphingomonas japonica]